MTDPPFESDLAEVLSAAGSAHHEYEQTALKGVHGGLPIHPLQATPRRSRVDAGPRGQRSLR
jgi:hypothetical protein